MDKETVVSRLKGSDSDSARRYARAKKILVYVPCTMKYFKRLQHPSKQLAST